jgi:hypothetical protein
MVRDVMFSVDLPHTELPVSCAVMVTTPPVPDGDIVMSSPSRAESGVSVTAVLDADHVMADAGTP